MGAVVVGEVFEYDVDPFLLVGGRFHPVPQMHLLLVTDQNPGLLEGGFKLLQMPQELALAPRHSTLLLLHLQRMQHGRDCPLCIRSNLISLRKEVLLIPLSAQLKNDIKRHFQVGDFVEELHAHLFAEVRFHRSLPDPKGTGKHDDLT
jgi:hypothetical protein